MSHYAMQLLASVPVVLFCLFRQYGTVILGVGTILWDLMGTVSEMVASFRWDGDLVLVQENLKSLQVLLLHVYTYMFFCCKVQIDGSFLRCKGQIRGVKNI